MTDNRAGAGSTYGLVPGPMTIPNAHELRLTLRASLAGPQPLVLPGVTDAMGLRLVEQAGFAAAYATGGGLANAQHALPDIGLTSMAEVVEHAGRITAAASIPVVVDADTGYGGPLATMRTIRLLERAGAAAIQVEDQQMPKQCGHFDDHDLIPAGHMQTKIAIACEARADDALVIIARTDARSVYGIEEAIERAKAYVEAGADVIFVEAPRTIEELALVGTELAGVPLVVNVVEGGKTPELDLKEYAELGFSVILFANYLMRTMMRAGIEALRHLREHGETASRADRMVTWSERQELFRLADLAAAEALLDQPLADIIAANRRPVP
ncbi:isocitrate lyase/PEP mutase family protein [Acrocarpospora macrocephala]|uniref:Carboxyvinyl-carboxyphosphonate phosphorylmutase n=1 Tax=Acrocarpospora macrocephala TaxID=150177 RepID=A0A5M3WJ02_9ACTN|nr:oxaloacetate decarboxylase [Acrocarpospora macrocephala]GES08330.1 carboxyvinyl-carboxyphosphonate phosphorylmutase [Acrocarpospora macrocephala]